jgi:hypothetical protein
MPPPLANPNFETEITDRVLRQNGRGAVLFFAIGLISAITFFGEHDNRHP